MSSHTHKQGSSTSNHWLSNILRPRSYSLSVESCLNLATADPTAPLDARSVLPLLSSDQPLNARCKHLKVFSELCKNYKFTHLENVFFTVQDILDNAMPREARHRVFEFMIACISGQYDELGMARVTFYSSLRNHHNWEDFHDMYRVLFALCKAGRDISGFEKNVNRLLITWMTMALRQHASTTSTTTPLRRTSTPSSTVTSHHASITETPTHPAVATATAPTSHPPPSSSSSDAARKHLSKIPMTKATPYLAEILHLLTVIAKFNFAQFEESEVTDMIEATRHAFFFSSHPVDIEACMAFVDVVVRYRFVPFEATRPFLEILCSAVMLPDDVMPKTAVSCWSIFMNLLRSHCAHSAILTLCNFLQEPIGDDPEKAGLADGAIKLLCETAWGKNSRPSAEMYMASDSVLLTYLRYGALQRNNRVNASILKSLRLLVGTPENTIGLLEWDAVWDICDICTDHVLSIMNDADRHLLAHLSKPPSTDTHASPNNVIHQFARFLSHVYKHYMAKSYTGPTIRFINVLYALRHYASPESAALLLDYYETEHMLLPSAENWMELLLELTDTFFIQTSVDASIRLKILNIVADVCSAVKDFHSEELYQKIILPMTAGLASEKNGTIRQKAIDLIVSCLLDCQNDDCFDRLLSVLQDCTRCKCISNPGGHTSDPIPAFKEEARVSSIRRSQSQSQPPSQPPRTQSPLQAVSRATATAEHSKAPTATFVDAPSADENCGGAPAMWGLVELFKELLVGTNAKACAKVFAVITEIANDTSDLFCPFAGVRLVAFDLLLHLRCGRNHRLYVTDQDVGEPNKVLETIRQVQRAKKETKDKQEAMGQFAPTPTVSEPAKTSPADHHRTSPVALSHEEDPEKPAPGCVVLEMDEILRAYIKILQQGPNWHVVIFLLERLPTQLSNKHLFCGATKYIQKLRRRLVKWLSTRKFLEAVINIPSATKRNDLSLYGYNLLTMLIPYRRVFNKQDEDEMVYAFYIGITQITAATKPCIHALTVCCHELPLSIAKMLNEILQRMSQIISVSSVSVHILEFLSGLARLPSLYANFTGDMYKLVFAIALNYLQYSHSIAQSQSPSVTTLGSPGSGSSTPTPFPPPKESLIQQTNQGALAQYVLIMAYLVITIWFTSVPLRERRKHVPFIIQRLLGGNALGKTIDEQTFTCIDMLSRFSFADVSLSPEKSTVSKILMEGSNPGQQGVNEKPSMRTWVYGHTLLTLKTAKALGWVEVTVRRPSGTISMMCNIENRIKSDAIDYATLPALLMMQYQPDLMASRLLKDTEEEIKEAKESSLIHPTSSSDHPPGEGTNKPLLEERGTQTPPVTESVEQDASVSDPDKGSTMATAAGQETSQSETGTPTVPTAASNTNNDPSEGKLDRIHATLEGVLSEPETASAQTVTHLRKMEHCIDPGFLYLQLTNYPDLTRMMEMSPPLPDDESSVRTLNSFDRIPVVDFHKIGVLYVGKGQRHEVEILSNSHGSPYYVQFLNALGTIQRLRGRTDNTGGLDREMDIDGKYAYFWKDDVTEMIFHVATMMPTNLERDPQCSAKKRHIGNDYVSIVYNDSGAEYAFDTLPGQFNFINIVVTPFSISTEKVTPSQAFLGAENTFFKVEMQRRPDMPEIGPIAEPKLVSAQSLPGFVRQAALHANIFAQVFDSVAGHKREYVSHWKERLRHIRRVKDRLSAGRGDSAKSAKETTSTNPYPVETLLDFTKYV
ncbi:uncharacterized protein BYT42DRAFT_642099 [Radiomyces spectabilis]|uniref:uncharacterized protein n=1 Tax=Radiomyces spectabilis TaxID=64574 RepID=UPI00221ED707|nr:uncharacterized protein BYT42DRAFT_642099 [Radiomyces spectabilis]KAI8391669.1 hypothetical protein BYT42DRAFT_642099 [Radiomyces spectabilis]